MISPQQFDPCPVPGSACEAGVEGEEGGIESLGEGDVDRVVGREGVAQFPDTRKKGVMRMSHGGEVGQILDRLSPSGDGDLSGVHEPTDTLCDLHAQEVRHVDDLDVVAHARADSPAEVRRPQ